MCLSNGPPPVFGRLQTLLRRQPEQGEEGPISWEPGLKQAAERKRKGRGSTFSDGGGGSSVLGQYNSDTHTHTYLTVGHWHIGLRSWIIRMGLSSVIVLAATLR